MESSFIGPENICGQTLLRLSARGSSIIAELFRLANHIPEAFKPNPADEQSAVFSKVLFSLDYIKKPEYYERKINASEELQIADDEFQDSHDEILVRFYNFFEGIVKYLEDIKEYFRDLDDGTFLQHSLETVLLDHDGKQLICEVFYLLGTILLFLDLRIPGPVRERLIVAHYRSYGESQVTNFEDVCRICKSTGFVPGGAAPSNYPEDFFARLRVDSNLVEAVIDRLASDDIYNQTQTFPSPAHRSTALADQASMLYVILYFTPRVLKQDRHKMREIIDKHFHDNWIIALYMGVVADLSEQWRGYRAANEALKNCLSLDNVRLMQQKNAQEVQSCEQLLADYLTEGKLLENWVLDHIPQLTNCLRRCNVTIRWLLLHRRTRNKKLHEIIVTNGVPTERLVNLLLKTSQLEFKLKPLLTGILDTKEDRWSECRGQVVQRLMELSQYFSGNMPLANVEQDEELQKYFMVRANDVQAFDFGNSTKAGNAAGRKIQKTIEALKDVERFEQVHENLYIMPFLKETCDLLQQMIRIVNVTNAVVVRIGVISDLSYAWEIINDYIPSFHERVVRDPRAVLLMRALFLKLVSILDVPLQRIVSSESPDLESVADYYSGELVELVRRVLEIIPVSIVQILNRIITLLTTELRPLELKLPVVQLKEMAQLDTRESLARHTHRISVFAEGMLAMEQTKLGMVEVDPREILEDGIRKELVRTVSSVLDRGLVFQEGKKKFANPEARLNTIAQQLEGFKIAFEYIQDYISIYGLKMWQEEFYRIVQFNVEQECNVFLKKKVIPQQSIYWRRAIPIPMFRSTERGTSNFMGRLTNALLRMTDYRSTSYAHECSGWYNAGGDEVAGIKLFSILNRSMGVAGLCAVDRLMAFRTVHHLKTLLQKFYPNVMKASGSAFTSVANQLRPGLQLHANANQKAYKKALSVGSKSWGPLTRYILAIGQAQLIRRQISNELQFSCHLDSQLLGHAIKTLNKSLLLDLRAHYRDPENNPVPSTENPLLSEVSRYSEYTGQQDPLNQIYVTSDVKEFMPLMLFLTCVRMLPDFVYDANLVALVRRKSSVEVDGAPFVVGIITILKQLNPAFTLKFLAYLGEYINSVLEATPRSNKRKGGSASALPLIVNNAVVLLHLFLRFTGTPRHVVYSYVPAVVLDRVAIS